MFKASIGLLAKLIVINSLCLSGISLAATETLTLNFRPLTFPEGDWKAALVNGSATIEQKELNNFGIVYEIKTEDRNNLSIQFVKQNGLQQQSAVYHLATNANDTLYAYELTPKLFNTAPSELPEDDRQLVSYFNKTVGDTAGWTAHVWDSFGVNWTSWDQGLPFTPNTFESFNLSAKISLPPNDSYAAELPEYLTFPEPLGFIIHQADVKSSDDDIKIYPSIQGRLLFNAQGSAALYCTPDYKPCPTPLQQINASAHWLTQHELVWKTFVSNEYRYELVFSSEGSIRSNFDLDRIPEEQKIQIFPSNVSSEQYAKFPHLNGFSGFYIDADVETLKKLLKAQTFLVAKNQNGQIVDLSRIQKPGVIDTIYSHNEELGLIVSGADSAELRLWAPTAQNINLKVYDKEKNLVATKAMLEDEKGIWTLVVDSQWLREQLFYRFEATVFHYTSNKLETYEVTDPYSVSLSTNSKYSQFVNLNAPSLMPEGWEQLSKAALHPSDISIMEIHVRDFSIDDPSVQEEYKGKYLAFGAKGKSGDQTHGQNYLKTLKTSGLTHVQLLPVNDFATAEEDPQQRLNLDSSMDDLCKKKTLAYDLCDRFRGKSIRETYEQLPKDTAEIPVINEALAGLDGFNWGYDPVHFGVPEGSYATNADGGQRIVEFRQMVKDLWDLGLRLSIDVVYNHTYDAYLWNFSVLDKLVPGYYFRRNEVTGYVESSSCCNNTASEHRMMEHLMIQTLKRWQEDYKVDAFRFDLMGHHMKDNMLAVKRALGPDTYIYGEGWNFGEVKDNRRGVNATQLNMAGTGIGTFNDRFRDALRGGAPFDCGVLLHQQGILQGLYFAPNESGSKLYPKNNESNCRHLDDFYSAPSSDQRYTHQEAEDKIRIGLLGSIKSYPFWTHDGKNMSAGSVGTWGNPVAYVDQPFESVNYISKHDNQTLWDFNQLKLPFGTSMYERMKTQWLGLAFNTLSQGVPFYHFAVDLFRSKSQIRDSYNAGDWFNGVDLTMTSNHWNRGLPNSDIEGFNWSTWQNVAWQVPAGPSSDDIKAGFDYFRKLLSVRYSTKLFRLSDANKVNARVRFLNSGPRGDDKIGVIMMKIDDASCSYGEDIDPSVNDVIAIFNTRPWPIKVEAYGYRIHPAMTDLAGFNGSAVEIGGRSSVVIIRDQSNGACYTDQPVFLSRT